MLIGEASHGTEDFYRMRAEITSMLIKERGFNAGAVQPTPVHASLSVCVRRLLVDVGSHGGIRVCGHFLH